MILFFCCNSHWKEFEALVRLSIPSIVVNTLEVGITITNLVVLGHLGKGDLAGACVAFAYFNMIWYIIEGVLTAQDTLCAAAFGMRDYEALRYWTFVSFFIVIFLCSAGTIGLAFSSLAIPRIFGVNTRTVVKAIEQLMISIPNLWTMALFRVLQKYMQAQNVMQPSVSASIVGVVVNLIGNLVLVYAFRFGFVGSAISTALARAAMLFTLVAFIRRHPQYNSIFREVKFVWRSIEETSVNRNAHEYTRMISTILTYLVQKAIYALKVFQRVDSSVSLEHSDSFTPGAVGEGGVELLGRRNTKSPSTENQGLDTIDLASDEEDREDQESLLLQRHIERISFSELLSGCGRFLTLGAPGGIMLGLEMWSFDVTCIYVSFLGNVALSAHQILLAITTSVHISIVFSIAVASSTRVANLLGARQPYLAKSVAWLAVYLATFISGILAAAVYFGHRIFGLVFSADEDVLGRMQQIAPLVAGFQVTYGLQCSVQGALRGSGKQLSLSGYNLMAFWCVGLPAGFYLTFLARPRYGLEGVWYGFLMGSGFLSILLWFILLTIDWEKEVRRSHFRSDRRRKNEIDVISIPRPGSFSIGSVPITHVLGDPEELEMREIELVEFGDLANSKITEGDIRASDGTKVG